MMTRLRKIFEATLAKLGGGCLDLLYPSTCATCRLPLREGETLCAGCYGELPRLTEPFCARCGEGFEGRIDGPFACPNCNKLRFSFSFARPACSKSDELMDLIHRLKYQRQIHLAGSLGKLAAESYSDERMAVALAEKWPLVPVPLHWRREQDRHFNQAAEIARAMASHLEVPVIHALKRTRSTKTQTQLTRAKRLENLQGAFHLTHAGQRHLATGPTGAVIIDDVLTTGSTVNACAKVLEKAGFKPVVVVTVMRG